MGVVQPGIQFLNHQMLEGMSVINASSDQFLPMQQVVGHPDVEIGFYGNGANAAILGDIVIDNLNFSIITLFFN